MPGDRQGLLRCWAVQKVACILHSVLWLPVHYAYTYRAATVLQPNFESR